MEQLELVLEEPFRVSANILRRLGEELNPNADQSILELVKNSYDADARTCKVELRNASSQGGTLIIHDDGNGMTSGAIRDHWLLIGSSSKSTTKRTKIFDRIPAGSKGLGRLAAIRMGQTVELRTRPRSSPTTEYVLKIDWAVVDSSPTLDKVQFPIYSRRVEGLKHGTDIVIGHLNRGLGKMPVKRLARALLLLADPFSEAPGSFKPELLAPEFRDQEKLVKKRYFDDAEYHLRAWVDADGRAHAEVLDWQDQVLFAANHTDLAARATRLVRSELKDAPKIETFACPPSNFDLWVFLLSNQAFTERTSTLAEVRTWLSHFGGVHVFQNGLRVAPYGNPGNDWLDMNLLRVRSPELRPSTNTAIGKVVISDNQEALKQKTDRSGFIEGQGFEHLRHFARAAMEWMAAERLRLRERSRVKTRAATEQGARQKKARLRDAIDKIPTADARESVLEAFSDHEKAHSKRVSSLAREVDLYRTLGSVGIMAVVFGHEALGNPLKSISLAAPSILRRANRDTGRASPVTDLTTFRQVVGKSIERIEEAREALEAFAQTMLTLSRKERRRQSRVDVHASIADFESLFGKVLTQRRIQLRQELAAGSPYLKGTKSALDSIVTNLLTNSAHALRVQPHDRLIVVRTRVADAVLELVVMDNGPGLVEIKPEDIWLPGQTTKQDGTGLGLTIVRDTVTDLGGEVAVKARGELGGAEFTIRLPVIGT